MAIKPLVDAFRKKPGGPVIRVRPTQLTVPRRKFSGGKSTVMPMIAGRKEVADRIRNWRKTNKSVAKEIRRAIQPQKKAAQAYARSKGLIR